MEPPRRDALGRAALVVGAVGLLVGAALTMAQPVALQTGGVVALQAVAAGRLLLVAVLGLVALTLGVVALLRRRPRSASAAGGTAFGAALLVDVAVGAIAPLLY